MRKKEKHELRWKEREKEQRNKLEQGEEHKLNSKIVRERKNNRNRRRDKLKYILEAKTHATDEKSEYE